MNWTVPCLFAKRIDFFAVPGVVCLTHGSAMVILTAQATRTKSTVLELLNNVAKTNCSVRMVRAFTASGFVMASKIVKTIQMSLTALLQINATGMNAVSCNRRIVVFLL